MSDAPLVRSIVPVSGDIGRGRSAHIFKRPIGLEIGNRRRLEGGGLLWRRARMAGCQRNDHDRRENDSPQTHHPCLHGAPSRGMPLAPARSRSVIGGGKTPNSNLISRKSLSLEWKHEGKLRHESADGPPDRQKTFCAANSTAIVTLVTEEEILVRAARKGDGPAFGALVGRYSRAVVARQYG